MKKSNPLMKNEYKQKDPLEQLILQYIAEELKIEAFLARYILIKYNLKNFFLKRGDNKSYLGVYRLDKNRKSWIEVKKEELEGIVQKEFYELAEKRTIKPKIKIEKDESGNEVKIPIEPFLSIRLKSEIIDFIKRENHEYVEEDNNKVIGFNNALLDWNILLSGFNSASISLKQNLGDNIPFTLWNIPHDLDVNLLKSLLELEEVDIEKEKKIIEREIPKTVEIFKQWASDDWLLLFEIIGYCLLPAYPMHKAFMLIGTGANGKSTYLTLVRRILGNHNVVSISLQELNEYKFATASLFGKLANIYADLPSKPLFHTGTFKILTGEDSITAARKFKDSIQFNNVAKLIFSTNQLPDTKDLSPAFFDRWVIIEFPNRFERRVSNEQFIDENFNEKEIKKIIALGIFAILLALKRGSFSEKKEGAIKEKWLRLSDSTYAFIQDMIKERIITLEKDGKVEGPALYDLYKKYCEKNDLEPKDIKAFYDLIKDKFGLERYKREGYTYIKGVSVNGEKLSDYIE
jgi:phage/plasmid primase, P4 family, C-terminal domain